MCIRDRDFFVYSIKAEAVDNTKDIKIDFCSPEEHSSAERFFCKFFTIKSVLWHPTLLPPNNLSISLLASNFSFKNSSTSIAAFFIRSFSNES